MGNLYDFVVAPFVEFGFMQRALGGAIMLSVSACPVGVFLMLRRMSLTGDAMAHAILPGAAIGFLLYGLQLVPMTLGGLVAGEVVNRITVPTDVADPARVALERMLAAKPPAAPAAAWEQAS